MFIISALRHVKIGSARNLVLGQLGTAHHMSERFFRRRDRRPEDPIDDLARPVADVAAPTDGEAPNPPEVAAVQGVAAKAAAANSRGADERARRSRDSQPLLSANKIRTQIS